MTSRLILISLLRFVCFSDADFAPILPQSPCDKPNRNILVEHFFNTIFSEFFSSPPVCVCVQMCPGQSTYCYPNGCFKSANTASTLRGAAESKETASQAMIAEPLPVIQKDKNNFILVKDERDFMSDFLEQNYVEELKDSATTHNPVEDLLPDVFKNKYNIVSRYKKTPTVDLRHNLQDRVKKDIIKTETEWTKTRWPLSRQNVRSGSSLFSHLEKPTRKQGTYFASMIRNNEIPDDSAKYFKRELANTTDDDEKKLKALYSLENFFNMSESKIFSLDKLIENLMKSSVSANTEITTNVDISKGDATNVQIESEAVSNISPSSFANETKVISMNLTNENIEKNKYLEISQANDTANLTAMIKRLSNQIEIENNTSMEIARRTIKTFDSQWSPYGAKLNNSNEENLLIEKSFEDIEIKTATNTKANRTVKPIVTVRTKVETLIEKTTESSLKLTPPQEKKKVTRKNRQKVVKKSGSSKIN